MFRHHPDDIIYINDVAVPLALFLLDEPDYVLPGGYTGREYVPGSRHVLYDGRDQVAAELPWPDGDRYIARADVYRTRVSAPISLQDAVTAGHNAIDVAAGRARKRYITDVPGQEATYLLKGEQAMAYRAVGYPAESIDDFPMVKARAESMTDEAAGELGYQAAADEILMARMFWVGKCAEIERAREAGKRRVSAAADIDAALAAKDIAIAALDEL